MPKRSAGLLPWRRGSDGSIEICLVHPGGPYWAKRDAGSWSIPKGEYSPGEDALAVALREYQEEIGVAPPAGSFLQLGEATQPSRKVVTAFGIETDLDVSRVQSNMVEIAWPPRSGRRLLVPEIDRAAWFAPADATQRILPGQVVFVERLLAILEAELVTPGRSDSPERPG